MTAKDVNRLIDKYLEGKTSPAEERRLALEVNRPDAPAEWQVIGEMLGDLTLGEALYDQTMATRTRTQVRRYIGWGIAVAACLTLWFLLGKSGSLVPEQEMAPQMAQQPTQVAKPKLPEEKKAPAALPPTSPVMEQVAYTPPVKHAKRRLRKQMVSVVEEVKPTQKEEMPLAETLPQVSEEEQAKVERGFQMWQLRQAILDEKIELEIATEKLNRKYEEDLAANKDNIEI